MQQHAIKISERLATKLDDVRSVATAHFSASPRPRPRSVSTTFFDLPIELRNLVYYFALAPENGIVDITKKSIRSRVAALHVCRQIREEATDVFLRRFRFSIKCGLGEGIPAVRWLERLGEKRRRIRCYIISFDAACKLRSRFANSLRHELLEIFSSRRADRIRCRAYDKAYRVFVADYEAVACCLRTHVNIDFPPCTAGPMVSKYFAHAQRPRLRMDELWYLTKIQDLLRDGGPRL